MYRTAGVTCALACVAVGLAAAGCASDEGPRREGTRPMSALVCERVQKPSAFEESVRSAQSSRREYGFRADRKYVERLQRDPAARARGSSEDGADFPVTARERRYFSDRFRVEGEALQVGRYLGSIRGLSGGVSIEDDGRRGAYVGVRITRALTAIERRAVAERARRFELRRVRFSQVELARAQRQIEAVAFSERSRVEHQESGVDIDRNAVVLEYTSRSPDAADSLQQRFGRRLVAVRQPVSIPGCIAPASYAIGSGGRTLSLRWSINPEGLVGRPRAEVREVGDRVLVGGVENYTTAAVRAILRPDVSRRVVATLSRPLGDRSVVSIPNGKLVPRGR